MMDKFWDDFETGEIHVRDKWQFELKSDFIPHSTLAESVFSQEFYIFIPNSLQINDQTYSKNQFYEDQTNLIRFKTPKFNFTELTDLNNHQSPLVRLKHYEQVSDDNEEEKLALEKELKLFANIFRSTLRDSVQVIIDQMNTEASSQEQKKHALLATNMLLTQIALTLKMFQEEEEKLLIVWKECELNLLEYTRDYLSISLNHSLSALLQTIRESNQADFHDIDKKLCAILKNEKKHREERNLEPTEIQHNSLANESILYQSGLLNKFFMNVLRLNTSRAAIDQKYRNLIGGIAAAVAMLFYILLFIWQGAVFVINSEPFILFTVIIYVLKDRLKDELKTLSFQQAFRWFSDFKTEIISPSGKFVLGELKESFSFIDEEAVSTPILNMRNQEFHTYLETIKRAERVIHYKKAITIFQNSSGNTFPRLHALNIIFRYDIHRFLTKASDPYEPHVTLNTNTNELIHTQLPKIYHVNIILKNTSLQEGGASKTELKKFRLVLDKEGIKRVENMGECSHNLEKSL